MGRITAGVWAIFLPWLAGAVLAQEPKIGTTEFAQGTVSAMAPEQPARSLRREDPVLNQDLVETGRQSYAIFEFDNHSRIAMREQTQARLVEESARNGNTHRIRLIRGGVRGEARRRDPYDLMVIDSPAGVVIVDEGEVSARWCSEDCGRGDASGPEPVAKVQMATAPVSALRDLGGGKGKGRELAPGDLVYERERIETGHDALAILVFRDDMRITLQGESRVDINAYRYFPETPKQNQVHISLREGRIRVKSGSVGHTTPELFLVETPVNRIRVRGTGFDLHCIGSCANVAANPVPGTQDAPASGLYTTVWDGEIVQQSSAGGFPLAAGQSSYVMSNDSAPIRIPRLPPRIVSGQAPRPDSIAVGMDTLFELNAARGGMPGLYVHVHTGKARVETRSGRTLEVTTGRTGYTDPSGNAPMTSGAMPGFMAGDGSCQ